MAELNIPRTPLATYRLQFRNGMTFDRATELIPHLKSLGVSHLYASPIFSSVSGSTHGYDVTDPNEVDPELGGIEGLKRLSDGLQTAGLGLILDIVPNHMAASLENPYWRDVLKWGQRSRFSDFFDNDWTQKLTLPVLDERIEDVIDAGNGKLLWHNPTGEIVFDYFGSHYPLSPSTYPLAFEPAARGKELEELSERASPENSAALGDYLRSHLGGNADCRLISSRSDIVALLDAQPWCMIHWRDAARGLSYRRFFEITGLVGVRVEDAGVFDATHRLILDLVAEGRIQGLRVDHIDGLADPAAYLKRLRNVIGPDRYLVVEKILEGDEQLPADWPVDGTTGYEFIADLAGLLSTNAPELDRAWQEVAPDFGNPEQALEDAKRLMVEVNFEGEISALARQAQQVAEKEGRIDLSHEALVDAVRALVASFDVYRTYGTGTGLGSQDRLVMEVLFRRLESSSEWHPGLAFLEKMIHGRLQERSRAAAITFLIRLQHLTGPILAKSLEDTFFYRYNRLIALNEVGGDPIHRESGVERFHRHMTRRRQIQPTGLSATSTHDTKRGEDARARLYAISEAPEHWITAAARWRRQLARHVVTLEDGPAPEPSVEWLVFQALAGAVPYDFDATSALQRNELEERFLPYVEKALREAKLRTNWSHVNGAYEEAVKNYARSAITSDAFMAGFWKDIRPFVRTGLINSLTQTLIKLTAPGVPDIYQGAEGADVSLVDPDNRRMPDFGRSTASDKTPSLDELPAMKTWLIQRGLALRNRYPALFTLGDYTPLESTGPRSDNIVAFARRHEDQAVAVVAPRLVHDAVAGDMLLSNEYWEDTGIALPTGIRSTRNSLSGETLAPANRLVAADIFKTQPFALLFIEIG